jgi:spermidine synthase
MVEDKKINLPVFGRDALAAAAAKAGKPKRKVLLLGSGFVARPCAEYIVRDPTNELTIGAYSHHFNRPGCLEKKNL